MNDNVKKMLKERIPIIDNEIAMARQQLVDFENLVQKGTQTVYEYVYSKLLHQAELDAPYASAVAAADGQGDLSFKSTVKLDIDTSICKVCCGSAIIKHYLYHLLKKTGKHYYGGVSVDDEKSDSRSCIINLSQLIDYLKEDFDNHKNKDGIVNIQENFVGEEGITYTLTISVSYDDLKELLKRNKK